MVNFPSDTLFDLRSSSEFRGGRKSVVYQIPKSISISTLVENSSPSYNNVHNLWGSLKLHANSRSSNSVLPVDFVMVIDHSSSMKVDNKLAFVLASIEFCLSQLEPHHRFSLILFNHQVTQLTDGLLPMTPENKEHVLSKLKEVVAVGSTNIGDALITALDVLNSRTDPSVQASVMLFSDGLSNIGLSSGEIQNALQTITLPESLSIHTFGFGVDHDSALMRKIAFSHHSGVYYYIDNKESIPSTFGESLYSVLSTVASNITIQVCGQDGCRITRISSRFQYEEKTQLKDYSFKMGCISLQENRSIIFRLSLRKMAQELQEHNLLKINVQYKNLLTNSMETVESYLSVSRPDITPPSFTRPVELDVQLNRMLAVSAIDEALLLARQKNDLMGARELIKDTIQSVESSISKEETYCRDLVTDLRQCMNGLCDNVYFYGIHYANAYGSMYSSEKSTGCQYLRGLADLVDNSVNGRHHGYGYATKMGEEASEKAKSQVQSFLCRYTVEL